MLSPNRRSWASCRKSAQAESIEADGLIAIDAAVLEGVAGKPGASPPAHRLTPWRLLRAGGQVRACGEFIKPPVEMAVTRAFCGASPPGYEVLGGLRSCRARSF